GSPPNISNVAGKPRDVLAVAPGRLLEFPGSALERGNPLVYPISCVLLSRTPSAAGCREQTDRNDTAKSGRHKPFHAACRHENKGDARFSHRLWVPSSPR